MKCRFIDTGSNDAYANMAIDEAILNYCGQPTLRVYSWSSPSISIGYNQSIKKEINLEECKKNNICIVRRITGGKAVFHDKEITYSFILPENSIRLPHDVAESYKIIARALVLAFKRIGIKAKVKKQPERIATPICFNSSNWYELTVNGKKISGSAQRRLKGRIMQHGPLLMDFDYEKNAALFSSGNALDSAASLRERITSIKNELNIKASYSQLAAAIKYGFQKNFKMGMLEDALKDEELEMAKKLKNEKYAADEWNFRV